MTVRHSVSSFVAAAVLASITAGCSDPPLKVEPTEVVVSPPVEKSVVNYLDFTGRTKAKDSVKVQARIAGYLDKINFKEGEPVKEGQVLFEIDDRTYKAQRDQSRAEVALAEAQIKQTESVYQRDLRLRRGGAISEEELEKAVRARTTAAAAAEEARADLERKQLNVDYCKILAPIAGIADKANVTVGNLISADTSRATLMTTIVALDPMYVYYTVDEHTLLHLQQLVREGKLKGPKEKPIEVSLGIGGGETYPFRGTLDFISNKVDASTGTLQVRGSFPNADHILTPGLFARVRMPIGDPHPVLLISEGAIGTNQGERYVYVVNDKNEVIYRPIKLGPVSDGLRIVSEGLKPKERVVVDGMLLVRPGLVVQPKPGEMTASPATGK